jgi:nucleotide-binding universal stress UspA family protein
MRTPQEDSVKVLVATDGSRAGDAAVRFAAKLVKADPKTNLIVLTVENASGTAHSERVLAEAARKLRGKPARFHRVPAPADRVPETISREADRVRADLVVIGSEGRDSLKEWVLGGTALRLIYVAQRPVTVVRAPRKRAVG